jgi:hypothetical protein
MKVFNLRCSQDHHFEAWFPSLEESQHQLANHLTRCPICDGTELTRVPSAPRLNLAGDSGPSAVPAHPQAQWITTLREFLRNTEDVGERFAEEARRIHYRESPERAIRGTASERDREALHEEGIEVISLNVPAIAREPLQ